MNDLGKYADIFDDLALRQGVVPHGYTADFLGTLTATNFLQGISQLPGAQSLYRTAGDA
jgi:hypothetical protein